MNNDNKILILPDIFEFYFIIECVIIIVITEF